MTEFEEEVEKTPKATSTSISRVYHSLDFFFRSIAIPFPNLVKGLKGERERGIRERRSREREKECSWKNKEGEKKELVFDSVGVHIHKEITQKFCTNDRSRM